MAHEEPYVTPYRRRREHTYRRRLACGAALAVLVHAALVIVVAPFRDSIPLVRHIGYRGEIRLLPEISVMREPGEVESEQELFAGERAGSGFEVVVIEVVDRDVPAEGESDVPEDDFESDPGEDLLSQLETSLPQPMSSEVVLEHLVEPVYPESAIEAGIEGVATFRLHVNKYGEVQRAWLLESQVDDACNFEAYRAIMQWRFSPYLVNGDPTAILVDQRIRFRLRSELRDAALRARR
jgi:TonB family protein